MYDRYRQNPNGKPAVFDHCQLLGDSNNDRQPEMAAETGNAYISDTMKDIIKIPMKNLGFATIES